MSESKLLIRSLNMRDTEAIQAIDELNTGSTKRRVDNDLWRLTAESTTSFGIDVGGKLAGFILADVRPWEFGAREPVGWIIAVGVDPAHKGHGIGRALGERVLAEFKRLGVGHVATLVSDENKELTPYFESLGLSSSARRVLEGKL